MQLALTQGSSVSVRFVGTFHLAVMEEEQLTLTLSQATPCYEGPRPSPPHRPPSKTRTGGTDPGQRNRLL